VAGKRQHFPWENTFYSHKEEVYIYISLAIYGLKLNFIARLLRQLCKSQRGGIEHLAFTELSFPWNSLFLAVFLWGGYVCEGSLVSLNFSPNCSLE
jgi:hypothetical protein